MKWRNCPANHIDYKKSKILRKLSLQIGDSIFLTRPKLREHNTAELNKMYTKLRLKWENCCVNIIISTRRMENKCAILWTWTFPRTLDLHLTRDATLGGESRTREDESDPSCRRSSCTWRAGKSARSTTSGGLFLTTTSSGCVCACPTDHYYLTQRLECWSKQAPSLFFPLGVVCSGRVSVGIATRNL
jgi:hypothetical protein